MLLLYILWDDWPIFMISASNQQLQQQLEYTLLKPDCHSWWISKMQYDTLEERYAIKFCFKLGKNDSSETYEMLQTAFLPSCTNRASSGTRYSRKAGSLWGMMRGVGGVRESILHSWFAKGLGLGLLCWSFKGVQGEILSEEASTLQIGSIGFPPGQCTSLQLHPFSQTIWPRWASRQFLTLPIVETFFPVTFGYSLRSEAVVMRELRRWKRLWRRSLTRSYKKTSIKLSRRCMVQMHWSRRRLLRRGQEFHVCPISKSAHMKKVWKLIVCTSYMCGGGLKNPGNSTPQHSRCMVTWLPSHIRSKKMNANIKSVLTLGPV